MNASAATPRPGERWFVPRLGVVEILDQDLPAFVTYRLDGDDRGAEARRFHSIEVGFAGWRRRAS